ncbi:MAG: hypothetical protein AAF731_21710, partial [Bacteroidota bacterium]
RKLRIFGILLEILCHLTTSYAFMPSGGRIYLAPKLFLEIVKLAKFKLKQEANLTTANIDQDNAFWTAHFSTFKENVRKKYWDKEGKDDLIFPAASYFYKRKRDAENNELKGIEAPFLKLLLIQCNFESFDAIFNSSDISSEAKKEQYDQPGKYTQPTKTTLPAIIIPQPSASSIEHLLDRYADTKWWFYFFGFNNEDSKVIVRLKFIFKKKENGKYPVILINTKEEYYHHYTGFIRQEECTANIMVCELKTKDLQLRLLHLKFVISDKVPEVIRGIYSNYEETRLIAGSILLHRGGDDFDKQKPAAYTYGSDEIKQANIPAVIKQFFSSKVNNSVKMPSAVTQRLSDLKAWKENKRKLRKAKKEERKKDSEQGKQE